VDTDEIDPTGQLFGYRLLAFLNLRGWAVDITTAPAGVRVRAAKDQRVIEREAPTVAHVACEVFEEALSVHGFACHSGRGKKGPPS
jgi:hypothetical protein